MFNSKIYWENRYNNGQTSGNGSYGFLANYKSEIINNYIIENKIKSLLEYGCGDGNQLSMINCEEVIGVDVSKTAIDKCIKLMPNREFHVLSGDKFINKKTDLLLSLDVIFHLVEDSIYENYMNNIINHSSEHLIIYSANFDDNKTFGSHVRTRNFTNHKKLNEDYMLIRIEKNKFPSTDHKTGSFSDWFFYRKKG